MLTSVSAARVQIVAQVVGQINSRTKFILHWESAAAVGLRMNEC